MASAPGDRIEHFFSKRTAAAAQRAPTLLVRQHVAASFSSPSSSSSSSSSAPPSALGAAAAQLLDVALERQLAALLFACGDCAEPHPDTVALLRACVAQHVQACAHLALDAAALRQEGHTLDDRSVVAALREAGLDAAADVVHAARASRRAAEAMLRVDLARGEEEACYSRREPPPDLLTRADVAEFRLEAQRRAEFERLVADGVENTATDAGAR